MTDLDLDQIPHPRDCHRVPVGATIPAGTFAWCMPFKDSASYGPSSVDWVVKEGDYILTAEPIPAPVPAPTPEDSPIIASGTREAGKTFSDVVLVSFGGVYWGGFDHNDPVCVATNQITSWQPAIVTPTGRGVMDDRDKRDRVDGAGDTWRWNSRLDAWWNRRRAYSRGTLAAVAADFGPLRFADVEVQA